MQTAKHLIAAATFCTIVPLITACSDNGAEEAQASYSREAEAQAAKESEARVSESKAHEEEIRKLKAEQKKIAASISREHEAQRAEEAAQQPAEPQEPAAPTPASQQNTNSGYQQPAPQQQELQPQQEQFPSPPNPAPAGFEWATMGPYGTGTSTNCNQVAYSWPSSVSECFQTSDGWYFYGLRQAAR